MISKRSDEAEAPDLMRAGRGRSLTHTIGDLNPLLRALGLDAERARLSARNGQGPWWNAGASHMNLALPAKYFTTKGLVSLLGTHQRLQSLS
jgi:hypothetical protein